MSALPAKAQILVSDESEAGAPRILAFAESAADDAAPLSVLERPGDSYGRLAVDSVHREVVLSRSQDNAFQVFSLGATGNALPLRTIVGSNTLLNRPYGVALDLVHDEIFVANGGDNSILVFARGASGNTAPLRRIAGNKTGLSSTTGIAVDPRSGEVFVTRATGVATFNRTASGNVAPKRVITGAKTHLINVSAVAYDPFRDELVVTTGFQVSSFPRTANGNVEALRAFTYPASLQEVDTTLLGASELVVVDDGLFGEGPPGLSVHDRLASGAVFPKRLIQGPASGLRAPFGVAIARRALLLGGGRFAIEATWRTATGGVGGAEPVALSSDTGYLWFFGQENVEVVVKVLDGCAANQRFWVFAAGLTDTSVELAVTDLATGRVKLYKNSQGQPFQPIQDTNAFGTCGASFPASAQPTDAADAPGAVEIAAEEPPSVKSVAEPAFGCTGLCLNQGRFEVRSTWTTNDGATGAAQGVPITQDTGYQWFFNAQNVETVVKVLDACALNGHYWVFAAGLTNTHVALEVTDKKTGAVRTYFNPLDQPFQPIQDTAAFASCP